MRRHAFSAIIGSICSTSWLVVEGQNIITGRQRDGQPISLQCSTTNIVSSGACGWIWFSFHLYGASDSQNGIRDRSILNQKGDAHTCGLPFWIFHVD
jgi:hypothetical protein